MGGVFLEEPRVIYKKHFLSFNVKVVTIEKKKMAERIIEVNISIQ